MYWDHMTGWGWGMMVFWSLIWIALLGGIAAVLGGGRALRAKGLVWPANGLLMLLAFPVFMAALFFIAVIVLNPRWN